MNAIKSKSQEAFVSAIQLLRKYLVKFSWIMIVLMLNLEMGCTYSKLTMLNSYYYGDVPKIQSAINEVASTPQSNTLKLISELKKGDQVVVNTKDGKYIRSNFFGNDSTRIVLGNKESSNFVLLNDILSIARTKDRYLILQSGSKGWHIKAATLNDEKKEITFFLEPLSQNYKTFLNRIHIFVPGKSVVEKDQLTAAYTSIKKVKIYDEKKGITTGAGILAFAAVLIVIAVIATPKSSPAPAPPPTTSTSGSSCPFVYLKDSTSNRFVGEAYGGAIYPPLERDDYMPLPGVKGNNHELQLKITNELKEIQHTNLAELIQVNHPKGQRVLLDKNGNPQTLSQLTDPIEAFDNSAQDQRNTVSVADKNAFLFNIPNSSASSLSSLTLTFKRPPNASLGKLVLNAKNSMWLDYAIRKLTQQFGTYYTTYAQKQQNARADKHLNWFKNQGLPLSVYMETDKGWKIIEYVDMTGPMAARDIVVPIDLSKSKRDKVKIKLECGFMFWDVDYAAMDFSPNLPVEVKRINPTSAMDEKGQDVISLLTTVDEKYLDQPEIGNATIVKYLTLPTTADTYSLFLHSRGHYEYKVDYTNKPNWVKLSWTTRKRGFSHFSKAQYIDFLKASRLTITTTSTHGN